MQKQSMIGIAQMKISSDPNEILVAPNLGSCLGIGIYDSASKLAGMIHCLLPFSKSDPEKAQANPCMYVDTGVAYILDKMFAQGANRKTIILTVAGGSNINDAGNVFEIGKKNYTILKKILWKNSLLIKAESVGADYSRTVSLEVGTGKTYVKANGQIIELT